MPDRSSNIISRFLDDSSDGTGATNAATNHTSLTTYGIAPPSGTSFVITRMIVSMQDGSGMTATEYGNTGGALSNGIIIRVASASATNYTLTSPGEPIVINSGWGDYCYDVSVKSWGGASPTDDVLLARWTFSKSDRPVVLTGSQSDSLDVLINDDLSDLVSHRFLVQGYYEPTPTDHRNWNTPNFP